jgi:hypothetical protein
MFVLSSQMSWARPSKSTKPKDGLTINHTPVAQHEVGTEVLIKAVITSSNGVYLPTVFYRLSGETQYFSTPMVAVPDQGGDLYASAVPGLFFSRDLEYYLEARDLKDFTISKQAGTPDKPFQVKAVDKKAVMPRIALTSEPTSAEVAMDGKPLGQTPFIGTMEPGEHTFVLSKDKFKTSERTVFAAEGRDLDLTFPLAAAAKPPVLAVTTTPVGARVTLDESEIGKSPLIRDASAGTHTVTVWLEGYQKQIREVSFASDRDTELAMALQKLPPQPVLAVTTQPAGALLSVDGTELGKTPYLGPLAPGAHELALSRDGYRGLGIEVVMPGDRDLDLRYNLEANPPNPPPPQVAFGTEPTGADVKVDGESIGPTPLLKALPPGEHKVSITAKGFLPYARKLWMPKDRDIEVSIALEPEPLPPGPSPVEVLSEPATTAVTIDSKLHGTGKWTGKLEAGEHTLEARAEGFRTLRQSFTVKRGTASSLKLALTPLPPEAKAPLLSATSDPKGARVLFDGQDVGATPYTGEVKPGEHTVTLVLPEFKNHDEKVKIPDDRDFELRIWSAMEPLRKSVTMPQVNRKAPPPPPPDAQQAIAEQREKARKSGAPEVAVLLKPTAKELEALCATPASASTSAATPAAATSNTTPSTSTTAVPAAALSSKPIEPVRVEHELVKPGLVPIVATAVGVAAVGVGSYFAYRAQNDSTQIRAANDPSTVQSQISDFNSSQQASLILFGAGGVVAGGVDVYWFLRSYVFTPDESPAATASKSTSASAGSAGP